MTLLTRLRLAVLLPVKAGVAGTVWWATGDLLLMASAGLFLTVAWIGVVEWPAWKRGKP